MACPNVKGPFGVRVPGNSHGIDKVCREVSSWYVFDVPRFLVYLNGWRNQDCLLNRNRKSESAKCERLPIKGVPAIAVFLSIGPANTSIGHECELLSERKYIGAYLVDIAVGRVRVLSRLLHEGIISSQYPADRKRGNVFEFVYTCRNQFCFDVEDVHAGEIEEWTDGGISTISVIAPRKPKLQ